MVVALGVERRGVLDQHAVVIRRGAVFNPVAGLDAGDGCNPANNADDQARGDLQPGADVEDLDAADGNRHVIVIAVDEVNARFGVGGEGTDSYLSTLAALQLDDVEISRPGIEHGGKVDVGFDIGLGLTQVGDGHILPGTGDEGKADALLFHNHLIVGAEGGRATRLAGVDGVASGDVDAG
ncbi:hypothetical protein D3C85_1232130 [compost metagenome]